MAGRATPWVFLFGKSGLIAWLHSQRFRPGDETVNIVQCAIRLNQLTSLLFCGERN
jgi:hypothetical protein